MTDRSFKSNLHKLDRFNRVCADEELHGAIHLPLSAAINQWPASGMRRDLHRFFLGVVAMKPYCLAASSAV
jgi:hypothetical protein